jgi:HSP20 family molecular chaperone IbpA
MKAPRCAELPGIDPAKNVDITVGDGLLTISGERKERVESMHRSELFYGKFTRTIALPSGADEKSVNAEYRDGILEVRILLPATKQQVTHIPVGRG